MILTASSAPDKADVLVALAQDLTEFVQRSVRDGASLDEMERGALTYALKLGANAVSLFLSAQGNGDLGPSVDVPDGRTLWRSESVQKRPVRTIFGEHAFEAYVYSAGSNRKIELRPIDARLNLPAVLFDGLLVGMMTGLLGVGGGFVIVPALNLLGGLDKPSAGSVKVGDAELSSMSNSQLSHWRASNVGFIFQFYNLLPVLSAQRNVELPLLLTNFNAKERAKRAAIALDIVGLADRAKHYPRELSGGQEQRVAIARAIVSDPSLLLCDEPTGDLDRETADEILKLLQVLNREHGKTIIMVTHDAQAASFAQRTLHCDKGTLEVREAA